LIRNVCYLKVFDMKELIVNILKLAFWLFIGYLDILIMFGDASLLAFIVILIFILYLVWQIIKILF